MSGRPPMPVHDRFMEKVSPEPNSGCWLWTACANELGYGFFTWKGYSERAHRVAYELFVGPIPEGTELDHLCRLPSCVNPQHLEAVTHRVNMLRGYGVSGRNARKTHCPKGHPYVRLHKRTGRPPGRECRECGIDRYRSRQQARA